MASSPSTRTKVFISYSRKDSTYLNQFREHLAYYERNNLLDVWSDEKIAAGSQWRKEIKQALEATKVAILFISPSFLASKFIAEDELPPLLHAVEKEGVVILPIIVRPSVFEDTGLANFQTMNKPSNPVAKMRGYQKDEFWANVAREIKKAISSPQEAKIPRDEPGEHLFAFEEISERVRVTIREEMQRQQEADNRMSDFRQAIDTQQWEEAETILQEYPNLPEARSLLGLSIYQETQAYFSQELHQNKVLRERDDVEVAYDAILGALSQSSREAKEAKAIYWLQEAIKHQDDPEGKVTAALALMYGYTKAYNLMIGALHRTLTINPSLLSYFQITDNFLMLLYACDTLSSIEDVARIAHMKFPTKEDIRYALQAAADPKKNPYCFAQPYLEWYAVELGTRDNSRMPIEVRIHFPTKDGSTYAQISRPKQARVVIPTQTTTTGIIDTLISIGEILKHLTKWGIALVLPK